MAQLYSIISTRLCPEATMINDDIPAVEPLSAKRLQLLNAVLPILRSMSRIITKDYPDYTDDALSIMTIAVLEIPASKNPTRLYAKKVAISTLMEDMFRSRKYLFYSARNKYPSERFDADPRKYEQRHQYPSPEDVYVADILIDRIFSKLKDDEKALLIMSFWGGISLKTIGRIVGKSETAIQKRRATLIDKIRSRLENGYCQEGNSRRGGVQTY